MPISRSSFLISFAITCITISSCSKKNSADNDVLKHQFNIIDSLIIAGKGDTAFVILNQLRPQINTNDPLIVSYYTWQSERSRDDTVIMHRYADSALAFFADPQRASDYPNEYMRALLTKGDASMVAKKYNNALDYYYKAKKLLTQGGCDDGNLAAKIAGIYYNQQNYRLAAQYWAENYKRLGACDIKATPQKMFFLRQGGLNNAAFAYEKSGLLDSAEYYYNEDKAVIDRADSANIIDKFYINSARIVLYDNLGGLSLERGNLAQAKSYLNLCLGIGFDNTSGMRIPPLVKLADIYTRTGNYARAQALFTQSRDLLNRFPKENIESELKWNRLYAQYLLKLNQPVKAYKYLQAFIRVKDSIETTNQNLYRLDVDHEKNIFHQQQVVAELSHQGKLKQIYLLCITVGVLLSAIIILLINRNLKISRKNHRSIVSHNSQLQQTLTDLESANKNYIRIMRVMAHDLRNPLSGISGLASILLDEDEFSDDSKHALQLIETTGNNSIEMINELLRSGLANEDELLVKQPIDLKLLLNDTIKLLQFKANEKQQLILFETSDAPVITQASNEKMWRVFNNLIINAIKFSYLGGVIKIGMQLVNHDKNILISVTDNGMGIPDKDKEHIFEMFTEAKKAGTGGEQPFGLGLSISKKIIEQHNGEIWFESKPGETVFYIKLPLQ
jgi:signal transduction histidine kinase